ncbi:MAG: hypothetical protein BWZ10_03130 [candidate division BRC1 bacterium ADurb.BinA364]|nr:MAG: hypothetical protein BWZ10_03130 [candidate division BRC1 bacterium ADurb.BinA364]
MINIEVAFVALIHQQRVLVVSNMARLHADIAVGRADAQHVLRFDFEDHPVDVGQLRAVRIDDPIIRIAHERLRRIGLVGFIYPGPKPRMLGIEVGFDIAIDRQRAGQAASLLVFRDDLRIADVRVVLPQIMRRAVGRAGPLRAGHVRRKHAERRGKREFDLVGAKLFHRRRLAARKHIGRRSGRNQRIVALVFPPVHHIVGGVGRAVRPSHPLPQRENEFAVVGRNRVAFRHMRHNRIALRRIAQQRAIA